MTIIKGIMDTFWNPTIWLPPNVTWDDLRPTEENNYANSNHLAIPLILAFGFLILRMLLERFFFTPFGISLGIRNSKPKKAPSNPVLEKAYQTNGKIKHKQVTALAKQLDMSERQVERWLRLRRSQDRPSTLTKFCETGWRWVYYTYSFVYGIFCLWDKPWLWDINENWYGYPHQSISWGCWWYYMSSLSFYWSLTMSQFFDVKRKDFWQMFVHHLATISLLSFSWVCNLHRIGTLVLLTHDCADTFLEAAKLAKYANYQKLCDGLFVVFTLLWIVTRLGVFPFHIIYSTAITAPKLVAMFPAYYIFNALLILLLLLHTFWTYVILKIAYKSLVAGRMEGDIRSSSSEEPTEDDAAPHGSEGDIYYGDSSTEIAQTFSSSSEEHSEEPNLKRRR